MTGQNLQLLSVQSKVQLLSILIACGNTQVSHTLLYRGQNLQLLSTQFSEHISSIFTIYGELHD